MRVGARLTQAQIDVLTLVVEGRYRSPAQIAARLKCTRYVAQHILDALTRRNLVTPIALAGAPLAYDPMPRAERTLASQ